MRIITITLLTASIAVADQPDHWAFRSVERPAIPETVRPDAVTPVDAFTSDSAAPSVERSLLLRRLHFDLIGLPPTRGELTDFLSDDRPDAWEHSVDRLLASPRHAERWGRHWMDVWRYADWYGLGDQLRYSQKHIWRWRDWIVESLNEDHSYAEMVREMLAADELYPTDMGKLRATGFLARNYFLFNRTTWLDDTIEHTSKAFLGLTVNCAKCHDHKYDPISQEDYYRFRAIFEPHQVRLDTVPGETNLEKDGLPRVFDAHPDEPTYLHVRGDEKAPDKDRAMESGIPGALEFGGWAVNAVTLPPAAHSPHLRNFVLADHLALAEREIAEARRAVWAAEVALVRAQATGALAPETGEAILFDEFDAARPELWEIGDGEWSFGEGRLTQSATGATRRFVRSRAEHPDDFFASLRFRTTGGDMWKSVGLCFDVVDGREKLVYLSAVNPGSKLQIALKTGASNQYPADAKQDRPVAVGEWYEMTVAVRGELVNVAVNGRHALAYRLPVKRERGRLDLIAFDAAVEFDRVELRELPEQASLVEPGGNAPASPEEAEADVGIAKLVLAVAERRPEALRTAHAADQAIGQPDVVRKAASAARRLELAEAELAVARAERELSRAGEKGEPKLKTALKSAEEKLKLATARLGAPETDYTSLTASLKALEGPDETDPSRRAAYPTISTGRRTALANWITDRRNPLAARVAVNHIWLRHFGDPLVEPVNDFGPRTPEPPRRQLLDWLAVEFVESGWAMKDLHRLMVTSREYRLPRRPVRMESQAVRDGLLHLAGRLDERFGGPPVDPKDQNLRRRSLYFTHSRDDRERFLSMFDDADILRCYRREESVVPQQALALANGRLPLEMARVLADRLPTEPAEFVDAAFMTVLARLPSGEEREACLGTLREVAAVLKDRPDRELRARAAVIHALFNHNDFVTIR